MIAVGACAASGGIVGEGYASAGGVDRVLPVDGGFSDDGTVGGSRAGYGFTGPAGGCFGASVLYPFAFQSFSGQNVEVW